MSNQADSHAALRSSDLRLLALQRSILRPQKEPCHYVDEMRVHQLLTHSPAEVVDFVLNRLASIGNGDIDLQLPPKLLFDDPAQQGDFRVMPCVTRGACPPGGNRGHDVCKTVKLIGTNLHQQRVPDQITVGKAFVIDPDENFISHIIDACLLSSARTGLCATLGLRLLQPDCEQLSLAGCGRVGYYTLIYALATLPVKKLNLFDCSSERAQQLAQLLRHSHPGVDVECLSEPRFDSDALVLATSSRSPVSTPQNSRAGVIVSLGADTDYQRELSDQWCAVADIYVDTKDSANYGDLKRWCRQGLIDSGDLTDLFQLIDTPSRRGSRDQRLFVSTGSALFDNLAIAYLLQQL